MPEFTKNPNVVLRLRYLTKYQKVSMLAEIIRFTKIQKKISLLKLPLEMWYSLWFKVFKPLPARHTASLPP